ncbi:hypothetical protein VCHA53O466_140146 [Vibrio chagasii]|nr:hypothetical protein VCHA53O466_140146 [Vibrio chagasii]
MKNTIKCATVVLGIAALMGCGGSNDGGDNSNNNMTWDTSNALAFANEVTPASRFADVAGLSLNTNCTNLLRAVPVEGGEGGLEFVYEANEGHGNCYVSNKLIVDDVLVLQGDFSGIAFTNPDYAYQCYAMWLPLNAVNALPTCFSNTLSHLNAPMSVSDDNSTMIISTVESIHPDDSETTGTINLKVEAWSPKLGNEVQHLLTHEFEVEGSTRNIYTWSPDGENFLMEITGSAAGAVFVDYQLHHFNTNYTKPRKINSELRDFDIDIEPQTMASYGLLVRDKIVNEGGTLITNAPIADTDQFLSISLSEGGVELGMDGHDINTSSMRGKNVVNLKGNQILFGSDKYGDFSLWEMDIFGNIEDLLTGLSGTEDTPIQYMYPVLPTAEHGTYIFLGSGSGQGKIFMTYYSSVSNEVVNHRNLIDEIEDITDFKASTVSAPVQTERGFIFTVENNAINKKEDVFFDIETETFTLEMPDSITFDNVTLI